MERTKDQHRRIRDQYAEHGGAIFYRCVMGDGGGDIHYGIYDRETTMRDATRASTLRLLEMAQRTRGDRPLNDVLDLGAGRGGAAHLIAEKTGAHVTCVELCEHHNLENRQHAKQLGIDCLIETLTGSFEKLPTEFMSRFDLVWSQEAICHAIDKRSVFAEIFRVLRDEGVLAFSDIMLSENAREDASKPFTGVNAVTRLSTQRDYIQYLNDSGFESFTFEDWTPHLAANFAMMRSQIDLNYHALVHQGVSADHIDRFANSLDQRMSWSCGEVLQWGAFCCRKKQSSNGGAI